MKKQSLSRRNFLKISAATGLGLTIMPSHVMGKSLGYIAPSDKLNIAGIGIGGKGRANLDTMATENIVALCDVDWSYAKGTFDIYNKAAKYKDWRRMFDEMGNSIDAVMVATPDHTHAVCASHALTLNKHVFCQKPLTHSVYESRLLSTLSGKYNVATQMGNQGNSSPEVRQLSEWIWNNEIGEIKEVHAWTNRPIWAQGLSRPRQGMWVPETLDWDNFIGPAQMRPYHEVYTPWGWRGWWDFGTGALGDMACHILDPVFSALKLKYPTRVQGSSTSINTESAPQAEVVEFTFPERDKLDRSIKVKMPEVKVTWYDGGILPSRPRELADGKAFLNDDMGGCMFVGTKDILMCDLGGINPRLLSGRIPKVKETLRRVADYKVGGIQDAPHAQDWIRACKESPENRVEPSANFAYAGPFNEMIVMGVLAVRLQALNRELLWDGENMQFTNIGNNENLNIMAVDAYQVIDGHPHFKTQNITLNAKAAAQEYIRHTYREGWSLPAMPSR